MPENKPYGAKDAYRSPNGEIYIGDVIVDNSDSVRDAYTYVRPGFGEYGHVTYKNGEEIEFPAKQSQRGMIYDGGWLTSHSYNNRTIVAKNIDCVEINTHDKKTDIYASGKLVKIDVSEGNNKNAVFVARPENALIKLGENDKLEANSYKAADRAYRDKPGLYVVNRPKEEKHYVRYYPENNPVYRTNILGF